MSSELIQRSEPPPTNPLDLDPGVFRAGLARRGENRKALLSWVRGALVEGVDFGSIPTKRGASKPSLWKPGAEKVCGMLGVTVSFPTLADYERAALSGVEIKTIILRCEILGPDGRVVADGMGARTLSQDSGDLNKTLKMAAKSAHVDATLRMGGLSEVFTQDLEDLPPGTVDAPSSKPDSGEGRPPAGDSRPVTEAQVKRLFALGRSAGLTPEQIKTGLLRRGIEDVNTMSRAKYEEVCAVIESRGWARTDGEPMTQSPDPQSPHRNADQGDVALLSQARLSGWDGDMGSLQTHIHRLKKQAASTRQGAQYADDGNAYRSEMGEAARLENLAQRLQALLDRATL